MDEKKIEFTIHNCRTTRTELAEKGIVHFEFLFRSNDDFRDFAYKIADLLAEDKLDDTTL